MALGLGQCQALLTFGACLGVLLLHRRNEQLDNHFLQLSNPYLINVAVGDPGKAIPIPASRGIVLAGKREAILIDWVRMTIRISHAIGLMVELCNLNGSRKSTYMCRRVEPSRLSASLLPLHRR